MELHCPRSRDRTGASVQLIAQTVVSPGRVLSPAAREEGHGCEADGQSQGSSCPHFFPAPTETARSLKGTGVLWGPSVGAGLHVGACRTGQHSVSSVGAPTGNCALLVAAYPACALGPFSVRDKHFLAWVRLFSCVGDPGSHGGALDCTVELFRSAPCS